MSLYKVLGIDKTADDDQIRHAYKQAVIKAHPDKPGGTPQKFKQLQTAYETLKNKDARKEYDDKITAMKKLRVFALHRPEPLSAVKAPAYYKLLDGTVYAFETAPDKLKCKFRFGDVVAFGGDSGCFVGLGSNGFYWTREGSDTATFLCCSGMGVERDIELQYRANLGRVPPAASASAASGVDPLSQSASSSFSASMSGSFSSTERMKEQQKRRELLQRERMRLHIVQLKRLCLEEKDARSGIADAVLSCFAQLSEIHQQFLKEVGCTAPAATEVKKLSRPPNLTDIRVSDVGISSAPKIPFSPVFQSAKAPNLRMDRMEPIMSVKKKLASQGPSSPAHSPKKAQTAPVVRRHSVGPSTTSRAATASSSTAPPPVRRMSLGSTNPTPCTSPNLAATARPLAAKFQPAFSLDVPHERKASAAAAATTAGTPRCLTPARTGRAKSPAATQRSQTPNLRVFR